MMMTNAEYVQQIGNPFPPCQSCMNQRTDKCPYCVKKYGDHSVYRNYEKQEVITNGDKIRQMTDKELAKFISEDECLHCIGHSVMSDGCLETHCDTGVMAWLQKEAE
jgi:predicted nucleic-acid-binding Zn-ribbon protein